MCNAQPDARELARRNEKGFSEMRPKTFSQILYQRLGIFSKMRCVVGRGVLHFVFRRIMRGLPKDSGTERIANPYSESST